MPGLSPRLIKFSRWQVVLFATVSLMMVLVGIRQLGAFQALEWLFLDLAFRLRPLETPDERIIIVGIDEKDIQTLGQWPMSDENLAHLLNQIQAQQPRAIGLDIYRDVPVEPGSDILAQVLQSTPELIGIEKALGIQVLPSPILQAQDQVAIADFVTDPDGVIRRGLISTQMPSSAVIKISLGVRLALDYLQAEGITLETLDAEQQKYALGKAVFTPFRSHDGGYIRAKDGGYQILLNYRGETCLYPEKGNICPFMMVSMREVLEKRIPPDLMQHRLVLIGVTAESEQDLNRTPYTIGDWTKISGVEIHAHLASQLISGALDGRNNIQTVSELLEILWFTIWGGLGGISGFWLLKKPWTVIFVGIGGAGLLSSSYLIFTVGWWIPVGLPLVGFILNAIATLITLLAYHLRESYLKLEDYASNLERKVAERTQQLRFAQEKSENLLHNILPYQIAQRLKNQRQVIADHFEEVTILFADIVGFTPLANRLTPQELVYLLNRIFSEFDQLTAKYGLEKIKTIGDAYMVAGGLPLPKEDNAVDVAQMALEMQEVMQRLREELKEPISIRIGINTGSVVAGVIGLKKFIYDLWGDAVNVASRMESSGEAGKIQVTATTYQRLKSQFILTRRGLVQVKGKGTMLTYWLDCEQNSAED